MKIRWTAPAARDLENIFHYLQETYPSRARSTVIEIRSSVRSLKQFPHRGRNGSEEGTRELPHVRLPTSLPIELLKRQSKFFTSGTAQKRRD